MPTFPDRTGDSTFNPKFDFVFRSVVDRLRHFDSLDECGQWNSTLVEDFRSDTEFIRAVDELFRDAVGKHTNGACITSDGISLESVLIDFGTSLDLYFRLHFLDTPNGYGIAPARCSVEYDTTREDWMLAEICCGLCESEGQFWYPTTKRMPSVVMPGDYNWACRKSRVYGPTRIASWVYRQDRKLGEL